MKKQPISIKSFIVPMALALIFFTSGCTSPGLKKMDEAFFQTFGEGNRASITRWGHMHTGTPPGAMAAGFLGGAIGAGIAAGVMSIGTDYLVALDDACIQVFESNCISNAPFEYVRRTDLDLPDTTKPISRKQYPMLHEEAGIDAFIEPLFYFKLKPGFPNKLVLYTVWQVYSPDTKRVCKLTTKSMGGEINDMFPYTGHPKHKEVFIQLARESAEQFLQYWPSVAREDGLSPSIKAKE